MPNVLRPSDNAVLSPAMRRGVAAVFLVCVVSVVSYLTSPNTGRDLGTALLIVLVDAAVVACVLALRWLVLHGRV